MTQPLSPPHPPKRPAALNAAFALMLALAAMDAIGFALSRQYLGADHDAMVAELYRQGADQDTVAAFESGYGIGLVLPLVIPVGFLVLAFPVRSGAGPARVLTWVLCGLNLMCYGYAQLDFGAGPAPYIDMEAVYAAGEAQFPAWTAVSVPLTTAVGVLGSIAVIALLSTAAVNAFFRARHSQRHRYAQY